MKKESRAALSNDLSNTRALGLTRQRFPIGGEAGKEQKGATMALFMDVHTIAGGVSVDDVAGAHQADLATQGAYGVNYARYWVDEQAGKVFCLVEAPNAETANTVHREAHGLVADEIYPVKEFA
jgi:hypothetical protein